MFAGYYTMFNNNKLRKNIVTLAIAPSLIISIFLLASFAYLTIARIQALEQEKFDLVEQIIATQTPAPSNAEGFGSLAHTLLNINPLHTVSLFDADKQLVFSDGLPGIERGQLDKKLFGDQVHQWSETTASYRMIPMIAAHGESQNGWILVEMDRTSFSILYHQGALILLLMSALALVAVAFCAARLRTLMTRPLRQLQAGIDEYLAGNVTNPIVVGKDTGFQELADAVSELAKKQQINQDDMQSDLEEYTRELRETLETVEIQNIQLDMARKNALQSNRVKSEFLANASHELRTPLNGIIGFASLLQKTELSNQQTDYLSTIEYSAQGLLTIINDILDISRLETGQLILEYKAVSVYQIIEDALKIHAPAAHEKKLRLATLIDPHVPHNLLGDPQRLKQVVTNLVSNAIKFSDKGNVIIRVNFMGETDNQIHLKFSISDSGIGLTAEQQQGLFKSFSQVDAADNRVHGGTGLGLAIARGLVNHMHGEIGADSEPGQGSTFWFTARLGLNNREPAINKQHNSLANTRVLVFDSNSTGRSEVIHLMNSWGARYLETEHFDRICDLIPQDSPHGPIQLAILDAQVNEQLFDKRQLRLCIEKLNSEYHLPVIVLALPNICRLLEPVLNKLQAVAVPRPISQHRLHRVILGQLGVASATLTEPSGYPPPLPCRNKPARVLAVDDNPANLRLISELLKGLGAEVETAHSGIAALDICSNKDFDLILMDIQMPEMDGMETTRRLREQEGAGKRTPIIALTAHAVDEQKTRLLLAGMDDYVGKPVSESELRHVIGRWISHEKSVISEQPIKSPEESPDQNGQHDIFDLANALELAKHKPDLARDMFTMLLDSLDETSRDVTAAVHEGDMDRLQEIVHKLYGGCCYCGVPALRHATAKLHTLLHRQQYHSISDATELMLARIAELHQWTSEQDVEGLF